MTHKYVVGDTVVFTNIFGVCWGIKTITELDTRAGRPTYHYENSDTPWFSTPEENLTLADDEDIIMDMWGFGDLSHFQKKYGFTPTDLFGCY